jgi:hypothetical protein
MKDYFDIITNSYVAAIFYIIFGIYFLKRTVNKERKEESYIGAGVFVNGIVGSIGLIALGLLIIYGKLNGKI